MKTLGITTAFGETVSEVIGASHKSYNGHAEWFFVCVIGGRAEREVSPIHIRYDPKDEAASALFNKASKFMSDYLSTNGRWLDKPRQVSDGSLVYWQPITPSGRKLGL